MRGDAARNEKQGAVVMIPGGATSGELKLDPGGTNTHDTQPPVVSIIIVNWNSRDFVGQCLSSIASLAGSLAYEAIVVDNASFDGCDLMVAAKFPTVRFIQCAYNSGFAAANNLALSWATGRYVLFLNPDTEIQGRSLQLLVDVLEKVPDCGMVGAHLLNTDLTVQTTCVTSIPTILNQALASEYLRKSFPRSSLWGMQSLHPQSTTIAQVEAISGACMMVRTDIVRLVGGFTADYFMYSEDMDLCLKVRKSGWKLYYAPDAVIVHHGGGSSSSREESNFSSIAQRESLSRFFVLHKGRTYAALYRASTAIAAMCRVVSLVAVCPVAAALMKWHPWTRAMSKWSNILLWSLGRAAQRDVSQTTKMSQSGGLSETSRRPA